MGIFKQRGGSDSPSSGREKPYFSRGWIDGIFLNSQEGIFDAYKGPLSPFFTFRETYVRETDESLQAERDRRGAMRGAPPKYQIPWAQVDWVRLSARESVPEAIAEFHAEIFKSSTDSYIVSGRLKEPLDTQGEFFSIIGDMDRTTQEWLNLFSRMGAKALDPD